MISYAQNQEDVLLSRLFPPGRPGFYIDVGANDPVVDSMTKHFYDLGWRGVNVEPAAQPFERLQQLRDRDVNLNVGLSDKEGTLSFYEFPPALPGSSTFSLGQAEWHHDAGIPYVERTVPVTTLAAICEEHVTGTIDFLTIDTEGHERQVLEGGEWSRWRPRVVVVEATRPNTLIPTHDEWEHVLTAADYLFAAFDGLNRFYVRAEDADLLPALEAPANVCDDFVPFKYSWAIAELRADLDRASRQLAAARALNEALRGQFGHLPAQLAWFRAQYEALEGSLRTHREEYGSLRASMADLDGLYVKLASEAAVTRDQTAALVGKFEGVGPGTLAVARRLGRATERFPTAKRAGWRLLRRAREARRARGAATRPEPVRLGIDYRLLASRENLVNRGIGRYTQQQLRHVLEADGENEYLLLCRPGSDLSLVLPEIRAAENVSFRFGPPAAHEPVDPYDRRGLLRRGEEYQEWIRGLGVDLYHATAPFVLEQTAPLSFDVCPMVATVYDLIPLVFPDRYLGDEGRRNAYAGAARLVTTATRLIAISDGTRDDAATYLGFPRAAIDCAWPFADAGFRPLPEDVVADALRVLGPRIGLPERFVLTVAALHHTKNLELLFAAYARLSPAFRRLVPLVVACHLDEVGKAHVREWAGRFGVAGDIVVTGYVSDAELAALYNRATVVAHPSRYEGFGLPVVEAMQCGAAVITTTAPSLPEVTAGAAVLVDPDDPTALAAAIEGLWHDPDRRRRMGEMGRSRAADFTPERLAVATLASYRAAVRPAPAPAGRLRVAVRSPFPPRRSEAADAGADLLDALVRSCDVEVFTDDAEGPLPAWLVDGFPVHHDSAFASVDRRRPFDLVVDNLDGPAKLGWPGRRPVPAVVVVGSEADRGRIGPLPPDATVLVDPLPATDPCRGRPGLERLQARWRLCWPLDRVVAVVYDDGDAGRDALLEAVDGRLDIVFDDPGHTEADDRLLGCDVVLDLGTVPRRRALVRAAGAGKPSVRAGVPGDNPLPATVCEQLGAAGPIVVADVAARLVALAGQPEELERRSVVARAWFEGQSVRGGAADLGRIAFHAATGRSAGMPGHGPPRLATPGLNKLCEVEDLDDPDVLEALRSLGDPAGTLGWSLAMSLQALGRAGMLHRDRRILVVGVQGAAAALRLTRDAGEVTAAGLWLDHDTTPSSRAMLVDPALLATGPFEPSRLLVQHADVRRLPVPDGSFDAVLSCHATDALAPADLAVAAAELARVVRAGGLVTLSTPVRLHGPAGAPGPSLAQALEGFLSAEALEPVDPVRVEVSAATMLGRRHLRGSFTRPPTAGYDRPLAVVGGALVACLHLALRKAGGQGSG